MPGGLHLPCPSQEPVSCPAWPGVGHSIAWPAGGCPQDSPLAAGDPEMGLASPRYPSPPLQLSLKDALGLRSAGQGCWLGAHGFSRASPSTSLPPCSLHRFPHVQKEGWASGRVSCPAAGAGVVAQPDLPWAGCGDSEASQGSAWQAAPPHPPAATATPSAQNRILAPGAELQAALGGEGVFHRQHEFGRRSGLSPRPSIPVWPVPSCTVGGRAWLTRAIPARLCLSSSQPQAAPALLPSPGGCLSLGSGTGRCLSPPAWILPARPPAAAANEQRPCCPPGPDLPSQSGRPNRPAERQQVSPRTSRPQRDSVPAHSQRSQPRSLTARPASPRQGGCGTAGSQPTPGRDARAGAWSRGGRAGARAMRCPSLVLQELAHPDGEEAGAKQLSGKSRQDPT